MAYHRVVWHNIKYKIKIMTNQDSQTILVTGGSGFIGANFIHYWLERYDQDRIINLDALTYAGNPESLKQIENSPNYTFIQGNICDATLVDKVMADVDVIVHFAAETHVDRSILEPGVFIQTNIVGTQVLLKAALKHKVRHFHHISTDEVFGSLELNSSTQFDETTPYDPRSPYSASKAGSDHLVRAYGETYDLPFTITNCSNNYGEYQFPEKFIPLTIINLLDNQPIPVYGDGLNVRDWLYVQDHCHAIDLVLKEGKQSETYLIGGLTEDVSNLQVVEQIINLMGKSTDLISFVKDRAGHDRRYSVNWQKIQHELGWQPSVSFEEGLKKTIDWYTNNEAWWRPLKDGQEQYFLQQYKNR
jgi:dTDP-glucose 4,6-dehydratase